jgi:hypothetical protein
MEFDMPPEQKTKPFGEIDIKKLDEKTFAAMLKFTPPEVWQEAIRGYKEGRLGEALKPFIDYFNRVYEFKNGTAQNLSSRLIVEIDKASKAYDYAKSKYNELPEPLYGATLRSFLEDKLREVGVEPGNTVQTALVNMLTPVITAENRRFEERNAASELAMKERWRLTGIKLVSTPTAVGDAEIYKITLKRGDGTTKSFQLTFGYDNIPGTINIGFPKNGFETRVEMVKEGIRKFLADRGITTLSNAEISSLARQVIETATSREKKELQDNLRGM